MAELVFSMGCPQCKRLSRMTFDEVKIGKPCVCSCGRKIAYDSNDVKSAVDEMKDMATILKIESKKHG